MHKSTDKLGEFSFNLGKSSNEILQFLTLLKYDS